jgi:hypothetical protein
MLAPSASSAEIFDQGFKYIFSTLAGNETVSCRRQSLHGEEQDIGASPSWRATICSRWLSRRRSRRR